VEIDGSCDRWRRLHADNCRLDGGRPAERRVGVRGGSCWTAIVDNWVKGNTSLQTKFPGVLSGNRINCNLVHFKVIIAKPPVSGLENDSLIAEGNKTLYN